MKNCRIFPSFVSYSCGEDGGTDALPNAATGSRRALGTPSWENRHLASLGNVAFDQCLTIRFGLPVVPEGRIFSILPEVAVVPRPPKVGMFSQDVTGQ
jgi:hypothetical protein